MSHVSRSKLYTLVSMLSFAVGVLALDAGVSGLFPLFVVVISFFSFVINSFLCLFGGKREDGFDAYQKANQTRSRALVKGLEDSNK
ncbi:hypothetical protein AB4559_15370 [Vibrio sp. 10N.222.51.C8]|uniref:hypothetical protein n=1 Tax=Vibrio TaxID=662 RepID=UPI00037E4A22|nr:MULTISPECIES: hypothetical protein [Vibrio]ANP78402.1 hypothetical protein A134_18740 [Vibrio crassostreae 9CS106]OEF06341.1 hypothetical protein A138_12595 [Vibrio crassostreae 9ZC77]MCC4891500.1 hypothetical protein [Vibrio sp. F13]NOH94328.1 hypothetical protein [Vibrio sp. AIC-3]OCH52522.1 hypothetical protein A6D97_15005 [Vibrio sp. ZF57]